YNRLIETICHAYRRHPQRLAQLLVTLSKAVLFDVEIFTAVYFHAADRASAQQLNQHADHFEREVSDLVKSVAASVSSLHDTAQSMSAAAVATAAQAGSAMSVGERTAGDAADVASTTEQLTTSIQEISTQVAQSTRIAGTAVAEAERTDTLVRGLVEAGTRIG